MEIEKENSTELQKQRYNRLVFLAINLLQTHIYENELKYIMKMVLSKFRTCYPINFTRPELTFEAYSIDKIVFIWNGRGTFPVAFTRVKQLEEAAPIYEIVFLEQNKESGYLNEFEANGMVTIHLNQLKVDGTISLDWHSVKDLEIRSITLRVVFRDSETYINNDGIAVENPWSELAVLKWSNKEEPNTYPEVFQLTDGARKVLTDIDPQYVGVFQLYSNKESN
jgi:hypothetical protein